MVSQTFSKELKKAKILAIDDDEWFIRLVIKKFKDVDPGFHITPAYSADEAIEKLEKEEFDCILCDHKLPGTINLDGKVFPSDGIHLMRKFSAMNINTPVIFVTGQGSEEIASEALLLGASGYFIKRVQPGYFSLMATSIRQTIDKYWLQKELQDSEARYRDLFENSADLILIFNSDGNLVETNLGFLEVFRYSQDEILGLSLKQLAYHEDIGKWELMLKSIYEGNIERRMIRSLTKDGQIIHLDITGRPIYDKFKTEVKNVIGIQAIARDITDAMKTQQALIDSEEKHRKVVEGSNEGIVIMEKNGMILDWNPSATFITGFSAEETINKTIWEILNLLRPIGYETYSEIKKQYEQMEEMAKNNNEIISTSSTDIPMELTIRNVKDNENRAIETSKFIIEHSKGYRVALVMRDVTDKKQTEAESRAYAKRFQVLIEQSALGVWVTSVEGNITTYVNDSLAQVLGYSPHEMIGVPVYDFATPQSVEILREKTNQRIKNEQVENIYPLEFYHRSGKIISTIVSAAALRDDNGNVVETYGFIRDVTEQLQREKELQSTKEFLESIINSMTDGLYTYDLNYKLTMVNPRLKEILGYSTKLIGKSVYDLFPSYEHDRVKELIAERMKGKKSSKYLHLSYITAQGEEVKASVSSVPLVVDGKVNGAVVTVSDITERKRIERYLNQIQKEYEILVNNLPLGMVKTDNLGKIKSFNKKAQKILKFTGVSDLTTINILTFRPFQEAGLANYFRDLIYNKQTVGREFIKGVILDHQGVKHHIGFYPFPIHHEIEPRVSSWILLLEKMEPG
ncbi:MAG: PAS domain S-box protein [Candidatus Hodarchaeota archaeon]